MQLTRTQRRTISIFAFMGFAIGMVLATLVFNKNLNTEEKGRFMCVGGVIGAMIGAWIAGAIPPLFR